MSKVSKVIINAGGRGIRLSPLTDSKPKCLLNISGKTILQRQIEIFRACDITDISIIRGHKKEKINLPQPVCTRLLLPAQAGGQADRIKYYDDKECTGMLTGLFNAEKEMKGEFIIVYSDILFDKGVVEKLIKSSQDISIVVDTDWQDYYQGRTEHPVEEAENVIIRDDKIIKIGKHLTEKESDGEFIGMIKFSGQGGNIFKSEYYKAKTKYWDKPFQKAEIFQKAYWTDMLQELIDNGIDIYSVEIKQKWWEIDTVQDLKKVRRVFN